MTKAEQTRLTAWRLRVLRQASESPRSVARTCRHFGLSRQAFYRWKRRYEADGVVGLCDRPPTTAPLAAGHPTRGGEQDSLFAATLPFRARQDRRLSRAVSPGLGGTLVGAPRSGPPRDEPDTTSPSVVKVDRPPHPGWFRSPPPAAATPNIAAQTASTPPRSGRIQSQRRSDLGHRR